MGEERHRPTGGSPILSDRLEPRGALRFRVRCERVGDVTTVTNCRASTAPHSGHVERTQALLRRARSSVKGVHTPPFRRERESAGHASRSQCKDKKGRAPRRASHRSGSKIQRSEHRHDCDRCLGHGAFADRYERHDVINTQGSGGKNAVLAYAGSRGASGDGPSDYGSCGRAIHASGETLGLSGVQGYTGRVYRQRHLTRLIAILRAKNSRGQQHKQQEQCGAPTTGTFDHTSTPQHS